MTIEYETLTPDEFDAVVTGELTHYAIWFEDRLNDFLVPYLGILNSRADTFKRFFLYREGLRFQDKIAITTAILLHHSNALNRKKVDVAPVLKMLRAIETFKAKRNALAHGLSVIKIGEADVPTLEVEVVTRAGKEKLFTITPTTHREDLEHLELLLADLDKLLRPIERWSWGVLFDDMKEEILNFGTMKISHGRMGICDRLGSSHRCIYRLSTVSITERERLKLDLFEKRFAVFAASRKLLSIVLQDAHITLDDLFEYRAAVSEASFLFDEDLTNYLKRIDETALHMITLSDNLEGAPEGRNDQRL